MKNLWNKFFVALTVWILIIGSVEAQTCGDNTTDTGEQCDNGDANGNSECDEECMLFCGNSVVDAAQAEQCDDGNRFPFDGCDENCQNQCGNGFIEGAEQCDFGLDPTNCDTDCTLFCGNNQIDGTEQCDDGNVLPNDGCSEICEFECGDGVISPVELCDDGDRNNGDGCDDTCMIETGFTCPQAGQPCIADANCGNSVLNTGQECDDGSTGSATCSSTCLNITCGNGRIDGTEACDDNNVAGSDGCSADCSTIESGFTCPVPGQPCAQSAACGNGIVDAGEECDDGNTEVGDGCSDICQSQVCGNNILEAREECDDGNLLNGDGCDQFCFLEPVCGDGITDFGEGCDDGNTASGDGCSASCNVEEGIICEGSVCNDVEDFCGNGVYEPSIPEGCDDGNKNSGDGCSATCTIEPGFICDTSTGTSRCTTCGDSDQDFGESCDDGNFNDGDGCSIFCNIEAGYECSAFFPSVCTLIPLPIVCGDGRLEGAEQCDDGNLVDGDGCDSGCMIEIPPSGMTEANCILNPNMTWTGFICVCKTTYIEVGTLCLCPAQLIIINGFCAPVPNPCGNGIHEPTKFEECDDRNNNNGDGCDETCFVENGFRCVNVNRLSFCYRIGGPDDPNIPVGPVEPAVPICGDGLYDPTNNEFCDDGNTNNGDGCNQFCRVESNNFECQNTVGQRSICTVLKCGNGILEPNEGEQCEDFNRNPGDGCSATCQVEPGWFCNNRGCFQLCGNNQVDFDFQEECDDGNTASGDGCDSFCQEEPGYDCRITIFGNSQCRSTCGNALVEGNEGCDDGGNQNGDGCSSNCRVEPQWNCSINPAGRSVCSSRTIAFCRNGIFEPEGGREECDDGNNLNTDGCTNNCRLDPNFECQNVPGQRTICGVPAIIDDRDQVVQVCRNPDFPLAGRILSRPVVAALANTPFSSAETMSEIVAMIVRTENGATTIDFIMESILQTSLVSAGLRNDWDNFYVLISLCAGRPL